MFLRTLLIALSISSSVQITSATECLAESPLDRFTDSWAIISPESLLNVRITFVRTGGVLHGDFPSPIGQARLDLSNGFAGSDFKVSGNAQGIPFDCYYSLTEFDSNKIGWQRVNGPGLCFSSLLLERLDSVSKNRDDGTPSVPQPGVIPTPQADSTPDQVFVTPKIGDKTLDACMISDTFKDSDACGNEAEQIIADAFCHSVSRQQSGSFATSDTGLFQHSLQYHWNFGAGHWEVFDKGGSIFSAIVCTGPRL